MKRWIRASCPAQRSATYSGGAPPCAWVRGRGVMRAASRVGIGRLPMGNWLQAVMVLQIKCLVEVTGLWPATHGDCEAPQTVDRLGS
jgi:hypothetical protein